MSRGNHRADIAAKAAATLPLASDLQPWSTSFPSFSSVPLIDVQTFSTPAERNRWRKNGCFPSSSGVWMSAEGKPCLLKHIYPHFAKLAHWLGHVFKGGVIKMVTDEWFTKGFTPVTEKHCKQSLICAAHNPGKPVLTQPASSTTAATI